MTSSIPACNRMSADGRQPTRECLGVVIDHRLRSKLARLGPPPQSPSGDAFGSILQELEELNMEPFTRDLDHHEYLVTTQLLKPTKIGGVIALLQQPADKHPFKNGLSAVTNGSPTLEF